MADADYLRGLADAAAIAEIHMTENFRMATDTVLLDPVLHGASFTEAAVEKSRQMMDDGVMFATQAHAARRIAEAIRERIEVWS